jgi:iron(III) transport system permease protein
VPATLSAPARTGEASVGVVDRRSRRHARPPLALGLLVVAVCLLASIPIVYLVIRATGADDDAWRILLRPRTLGLLLTSLIVCLGTAAGAVLLGVPLAWLTSRTDLPWRRVWTVLVVAPLAVPSYLLAYAFVAALAPDGPARELLRGIGVEGWLPGAHGVPGAIMVLTLSTYPLVLLATRGALARVDPAMAEVARSLGDGPLRAFLRGTLPMLLPAVGAGTLLAALYALSDFGSVAILRADTFARAVASQYGASLDRSGAALFSLVLVAFAVALVTLEWRIRRGYAIEAPHASRRVFRPVHLGRWRWPALAACSAVVTLALVIPALTVLAWLARGAGIGTVASDTLHAAVATLGIAGTAAIVVMVLVLPVSITQARYPGRLAGLSRLATGGSYAVPGISFALAAVFASLSLVPGLYRTLPVLVLALAVRHLALGTAPVTGAMLLIGRGVTDVARSLGDGTLRVALRVGWPLVRPGVIAGLALSFLTLAKELPVTLFLAPPGTRTLATRLWTEATEGGYAAAAGPALVLLMLSLASVGLLLRTRAMSMA